MTTTASSTSAPGPARRYLGLGLAGLALAGWPLVTASGHGPWGAIVASWLFVTGAGLGCVVLSASARVAYARWADALLPACQAAVGLLPWSFAALVAISAAGPLWLPWVGHAPPERQWWLNVPFFEVRQVLLALLLFGLAWLYARTPAEAPTARPRAVAFLIAFAVVTTLWTVDFVMALDPVWVDPMLGGFYFMGSFLAGAAVAALAGAGKRSEPDLRHDLGKLFFGLATFWAYLLFVQTLVIWFGDQPDETAFVVLRMVAPWRQLGLASVLLVFLVPFATLMREAAKRRVPLLQICAVGVLLGLFIEMQLLVLPSLERRPSLASISAAVGALLFLGSRLAAALRSPLGVVPAASTELPASA